MRLAGRRRTTEEVAAEALLALGGAGGATPSPALGCSEQGPSQSNGPGSHVGATPPGGTLPLTDGEAGEEAGPSWQKHASESHTSAVAKRSCIRMDAGAEAGTGSESESDTDAAADAAEDAKPPGLDYDCGDRDSDREQGDRDGDFGRHERHKAWKPGEHLY